MTSLLKEISTKKKYLIKAKKKKHPNKIKNREKREGKNFLIKSISDSP